VANLQHDGVVLVLQARCATKQCCCCCASSCTP